MDVIKWLSFGKSLKQLFIISLISCFILLGSSFVNSEWIFHDANESFSVPNASAFTLRVASSSAGVLDGGGMSSPKPLIMLQSNVSNSREYRYLYFWGTDNKLYAYGNSNGTPNNPSGFEYLKFNTFYRFSNTGFVNCNYSNLHNTCGSEGVSSESFYSDTSLKGSMTRFAYYFDNGNGNYTAFCWVYDNLGFSICVKPSTLSTTELTPVSGLSIDPVEFNADLIGFSPWISGVSPNPGGQVWTPGTGSRLNGRLVVNSGYTNSDMVNGFECVGLQPALCYGGFDIDNIFDPSEQYEDFTGYRAGQGATIFEIYNLYSGNFASLKQFLDTVLTRYQNGQINSFKTEPKALLMLGAQMNTAGFKTSYIANYCNLLLNENNNNIYTGNSVDDLRVQSCIRSQKIGDSLREGVQDIGFQTTTGGFFSGGDIDFDPDTFFSNIMDTIDRNLNQNLSGGLVGLLPGYIVLVFLGLVFIRLITH